MAEVTGIIQSETEVQDVILNNAATESTLKQLLASSMAANDQTLATLKNWASKAGLSSESFDETNQNVGELGKRAGLASQEFTGLSQETYQFRNQFSKLSSIAENLVSGSGSLNSLLGSFGRLHGWAGLTATALKSIADFQETALKSYRDVSSAGVNFGGSLTDLRFAASQTYLTLDQFTNVIKNNSTTLARMGGTVDEGARNFVQLSNSLIGGDVGSRLMALGYTTEEINNSMLSFINITGGRTEAELKNTEKLTQSTGEYLTELDLITQFTGVSRKKLEDDQKKAAESAAFQRKLASMSDADRAKTMAAYNQASATGVKGATDIVMATALGLPVISEAGRTLQAVMPAAGEAIRNTTLVAMDNKSHMEDVNSAAGQIYLGFKRNAEGLGRAGDAVSMMPSTLGEVVNGGIAVQNLMNNKGIDTATDYQKTIKEIGDKQSIQARSQANTAAQTEITVKQLGNSILNNLLGPLSLALGVLDKFVGIVSRIIMSIAKVPLLFDTLAVALIATIGALTAAKTVTTAKTVIGDLVNATGRTAREGFGTLGTITNPMWVRVVGGGGLGGVGSSAVNSAEAVAGEASALKNAAKFAKGAIVSEIVAATVGSLGDYLVQRGNTGLGGTANVVAGVAEGYGAAATGLGGLALLGVELAPFTAGLSLAAAAVAGGGYELYKNWDNIFGTSKNTNMPDPNNYLERKEKLGFDPYLDKVMTPEEKQERAEKLKREEEKFQLAMDTHKTLKDQNEILEEHRKHLAGILRNVDNFPSKWIK
jgi:hypothetical protein